MKNQIRLLGAMLVVLQATDGFLTMWATNNGFVEINPLAAPIAHSWLFPAWKIAATVLGVWLLFYLSRRLPRAVLGALCFALVFISLVLLANVAAVLEVYLLAA